MHPLNKKFLQNFLNSQATKRIQKIDQKIRSTNNEKEINLLQREKESVMRELKECLKLCENEKEEKEDQNSNKNLNLKNDDLDFNLDQKTALTDTLTIPTYLYNYLLPHQKDSLFFFHKQKGCILADEMGLGKSVQVLAYLSTYFYQNTNFNDFNFLIVCPASLISHWVKEINKVTPFFQIRIVHRSYKETGHEKKKINNNLNTISSLTIYITSYNSFNKLPNIPFHTLIFDEAHKLKNKHSLIYKQVYNKIKKERIKRIILMTGTPVQNNLKELWTLFFLINEELLGTAHDFEFTFLKSENLSYLKSIINPFILRRMKKSILNLKKREIIIKCPLSVEQRILYRRKVREKNRNLLKKVDELRRIVNYGNIHENNFENHFENIHEKNHDILRESGKMAVVDYLLRMWAGEYFKGVEYEFEEELTGNTAEKNSNNTLTGNTDPNNNILIFSQSITMLNILEKYLISIPLPYTRIDGQTPIPTRQKKIDIPKKILLLSTKTGAFGFNLTHTNKVIIIDPEWNPSIETQAMDRTHRIGQMNAITCVRLITPGTIEEYIYDTAVDKEILKRRLFGMRYRLLRGGRDTVLLVEMGGYKRLEEYCFEKEVKGVLEDKEEENVMENEEEIKEGIKEEENKETDKKNLNNLFNNTFKEINQIKSILSSREMIDFIRKREKMFKKG